MTKEQKRRNFADDNIERGPKKSSILRKIVKISRYLSGSNFWVIHYWNHAKPLEALLSLSVSRELDWNSSLCISRREHCTSVVVSTRQKGIAYTNSIALGRLQWRQILPQVPHRWEMSRFFLDSISLTAGGCRGSMVCRILSFVILQRRQTVSAGCLKGSDSFTFIYNKNS